MKKSSMPSWLLVFVFILIGGISCQKKGDFINEDKIGDGIYYYPVILNKSFTDTLIHKNIAGKDVTFSPGQKIIFQLKYRSKDSIDRIELWQEINHHAKKIYKIAYNPAFFSEIKKYDTTFLTYQIPNALEDTVSFLTLRPKVVTKFGLEEQKEITVPLAR